jgi:hypothetical protein
MGGQFVSFDGAVHSDDFFGEVDAIRPDRLSCQPSLDIVDSIRVENRLDVSFDCFASLSILDELLHSIGEICLLAKAIGEDGRFVSEDSLDLCISRSLECSQRAERVAEQDRFASRNAFTDFSHFWQHSASFQLRRLTQDGETEPPGEELTDRQHEALRTAYELGYFDIPRRTSLEDVAAELDLSASSVSERLRRAQTQLIEETVAPTWPPLST